MTNNNSVIEEYEDINMEELENKSRVEMIRVAKSINLPSPTVGKKNELFERIKTFISSKKQMKKKQIQQNKPHTFESSCFDLQIKEIENTERLFWKVFRNKVMFNEIVSNLSSNDPLNGRILGITTFRYNEIINVSWMLQFDHLELLKLKILNGEPLSFANHYRPLAFDVTTVLLKLFKKFDFKSSNIEQGIQFYTIFFKHYWSTISLLVGSIYSTIFLNNYIVLKVLLDNEYIKPTTDFTLSGVISNNSLKLVKLVTGTIIKQQDTKLPLDFKNTKNLLLNKSGIKIEIINYLLESNIISQEILDELVDKVGNNLFEPKLLDIAINRYYENKISIFNRYKLNDLFKACKLILSFKKHKISNNNNISTSLTIDNINEIKPTFTKQQLNQILNPLIINLKQQQEQQQQELNNIKKLILLYLSYEGGQTKLHCSRIFVLLFGDEIELKESFGQGFNKNYFRQTLKYGNSEKWLCYNQYINEENFVKCIRNYKKESKEISRSPLLFRYCNGYLSIDSKIQFIKDVYKSMFSNSKNLFLLLLLLVIEIDDLELLKQVVLQIQGITNKVLENLQVIVQFKITEFIKSIEMLDYCWVQFNPLFKRLTDEDGSYFYHFMDPLLLKRYDELKFQELKETNSGKLPSIIIIDQKLFTRCYQAVDHTNDKTSILYLKMIKYVIQNTFKSISIKFSDDLFKRFQFPSAYLKLSNQQYNELILDFQFIIENLNVFYDPFESTKIIANNVITMKLMEWEYQYRQHGVNRCTLNYFTNSKMYYITGRFNLLAKEPENNWPWNEVILSNLEFIETYFKCSTFLEGVQKANLPIEFSIILETAAIYNRLDIFQYIFKNHPLLLKKKVGRSDGLLSVQNFGSIFNRCLTTKNYRILEFFESVGMKLPKIDDKNYNIYKSNNNNIKLSFI